MLADSQSAFLSAYLKMRRDSAPRIIQCLQFESLTLINRYLRAEHIDKVNQTSIDRNLKCQSAKS